jgi:single-strand DNA-binding protein
MQINDITISGKVVRDPELKQINDKVSVTNITIVNTRTTKNKQGEVKNDSLFIDVVVWGKKAKELVQVLSKGSPVLVLGVLIQESWEDKDGKKQSKTKIRANQVIPLTEEEKDGND